MASSSKSRQQAAEEAGWRGLPAFSPESIAIQWAYPQLYMRVWAQADGFHLLASVEQMGDDGRLIVHQVGRAVWRPTEVTEEKVVDWGRRALVAWLERRLGDREG